MRIFRKRKTKKIAKLSEHPPQILVGLGPRVYTLA